MNPESLRTPSPVIQGWFDVIKGHLSKFDPVTVDIALYGIGGFIIGYLLKNFGRLFVLSLIGIAVLLAVLQYTHLYTVDMQAVKTFLGLGNIHSVGDVISFKMAWVKEHPIAALTGALGLLLGWKVG